MWASLVIVSLRGLKFQLLLGFFMLCHALEGQIMPEPASKIFHSPKDSNFFSPDKTRDAHLHSWELMSEGNYGSVGYGLVNRIERKNGFNLGWEGIDKWFKWQIHEQYPDTNGTLIRYQQGSRKFLALNIIHGQNLSSKGKIFLDFQRMGSKGTYLHQNTDHYFTRLLSPWIISKKGHHLLFEGAFLKSDMEFNGGIKDPTTFYTSGTFSREGADTYFSTAQRTWRDRQMAVSLATPSKNGAFFTSRIQHRNSYTRYTHTLTDFSNFPPYLFDSTQSLDSNRIQQWDLSQSWAKNIKDIRLQLQTGWLFSSINGVGTWNAPYISWELKSKKTFAWFLEGTLYLTNHQKFSQGVSAGLSQKFGKQQTDIKLIWQQEALPYLRTAVKRNHYQWDFIVPPNQSIQAQAAHQYISSRFTHSLTAKAEYIQRIFYWDSSSTPRIHTDPFLLFTFSHEMELKGKHAYWKHHMHWQPGNSILPRPEWMWKEVLAWRFRFFGSPMIMDIGAECFGFSKFNASVFDPYMQWYRWQDSVKAGGYPMLNLFVSGEIPGFRFFVQADHLLYPWIVTTNYPYSAAPHQPYYGLVIRLGMTWFLKEPEFNTIRKNP